MRFNAARLIILALLLLGISPTLAQSGAIEFEADSIRYDNSTGNSIYRGDVRVTRGDMSLQGDEVEVLSERGRISRIVSRANPSVFLDRSAGKQFMAAARQIEYDVEKKIILLSGDAKIDDGEKLLEGERIVYDLENRLIDATKSKGRVRLRIDN